MSRDFQPAVYIMANHKGGTPYVGVTSDLASRKLALVEASNSEWRDLFFELNT